MLKQIIILGQIEHRILFEHQNLMDQILNIISSSRKYSNIIQIPRNIQILEYIRINLQKNVKVLESKIFI